LWKPLLSGEFFPRLKGSSPVSRYDVLLFFHIVMAVTWVGGGLMIQFFGMRATAAGGERAAAFLVDVEWIGNRFLTPSSLLAFASGVFLVVDGPWSFADDWITLGLALFGITFLAGAGFFGPESKRLGNLIADHGFDSPQAQRRISRLILLSRLDLVLLFLILYDMAVKPSFGDPATIVVGLVAAAVAAGLVLWRGPSGGVRERPAAASAD
jgi:uncharacterized membrane protein